MKKLFLSTMFVCAALLLPIISSATPPAVPRYLNYQSLLYDDGGNLIQDGPADISFKITDALGNVLYEERQTPDVVRGMVSVLIGNGLDANGAPTGGIPQSVFLPDSARYLDVQVEGFPPESNLEIVSVPYALYAEKALSVKDESVGSAAIAKKSVTMEHLADGLINELASQMAGGGSIATRADLTNLQTQYRQLSGASTIGVSGNFVYSGNNSVSGVLLDIDRAVQMRQSNINLETTTRQTADTNETNARATADTTLQTNITSESAARQAADTTLQTNINNEVAARVGGDTTLQTNINNEAAARQATDTTESNTRIGADAALQAGINTKVARSGDTMSGILDMNTSRITNVGAPVDRFDATRQTDLDALHGSISADIAADFNNLNPRVINLEQFPHVCAAIIQAANEDCDGNCGGYNIQRVHYETIGPGPGRSECGGVPCGVVAGCRFVNVHLTTTLAGLVSISAIPNRVTHGTEFAELLRWGSSCLLFSLSSTSDNIGISVTAFCGP